MNETVTEGLEQAVDALVTRGIEAGEREAEALLARARAEAERIRTQAQRRAEQVVEQAQAQARRTREQLELDLRQAAAAGVLALRQGVERAVLGAAVDEALETTLGDEPTLADLLVEAVRAFASSPEGNVELEVLVPATVQQSLAQALLARVQQVARRGVQIRLDGGVTGGFLVDAAGVQLDFRDAAFREVLMRFMAPRFARYLAVTEGAAKEGAEA
ncbi:MAG: hypothetical protein AAGF11_30190 [Myxococcota bacterium]